MKRACFLLKIKNYLVEEYKRVHEPVWPEMLEAIRTSGIRNYSLFLKEDGLLIGYFESEDPQDSLRKLGETDVNKRWQERMSPYFDAGSGDLSSGAPKWLEQVFFLE